MSILKAVRAFFRITLVFMVAILTIMFLMPPSKAMAQPASTANLEKWITNGTVYAIASTPEYTYIGGSFTLVGPNTGSFVTISSTTGEVLPSHPHVNAMVGAYAEDGSG